MTISALGVAPSPPETAFPVRFQYDLSYASADHGIKRLVKEHSLNNLTAQYISILWDEGSHKTNVRSFLGEICEILGGERFSVFTQEMLDFVIGTLRERGNSNATINRKMAALSKLLRKACKMGDIYNLPEFRRQKERQGRIRFLEAEEEQRLFSAIRMRCEDSYRLSVFLVDTGCRLGEAIGLNWNDLQDFALDLLADKIRPQPHGSFDHPGEGGRPDPAWPVEGSLRHAYASAFPRDLERSQGGSRTWDGRSGGPAYSAPYLRFTAGARRHRYQARTDLARPSDPVDDDALRSSRDQ